MEVHYGFDVKRVRAHAVNDGVGKTIEVELAIIFLEFPPPFRFGNDAAQSVLELVNEVAAQTRLPFFVPQRGGGQFRVGFRMADDAHGAGRECREPLPPPDGN